VGLWDAITGRSRAPQPDLDALFAVPSAAIALETELGLRPTGVGSVCFRAPAGAAYADTQADVVALLGTADAAPEVTTSRDSYGYTWLVIDGDPADTDGLCTGLHAVNTTLADQGFATGLLCTVVVFADSAQRRVGLVYLYKQSTFYPFAPARAASAGEPLPDPLARDNLLELSVRDVLTGELPLEQDMTRWLAVYAAPGL
jgi:hypothetical protein